MNYLLNIKKIIFELKITQQELAHQLGISRQQLNNIIHGRSKFSYEHLYKLNKIYGVNLNFLFTGDGEILLKTNEIPRMEPEEKMEDACKIPQLTTREIQIMEILSKGCTYNEIAKNLLISPHTVKAHMSTILHKFKASNRLQAANLYNQHKNSIVKNCKQLKASCINTF